MTDAPTYDGLCRPLAEVLPFPRKERKVVALPGRPLSQDDIKALLAPTPEPNAAECARLLGSPEHLRACCRAACDAFDTHEAVRKDGSRAHVAAYRAWVAAMTDQRAALDAHARDGEAGRG